MIETTLIADSATPKDKRSSVPRHVAIITDGNRRWAKARGLPISWGHRKGADRALDIVASAASLGVEVLTLYCFSTENWRRDPEEITFLMRLITDSLQRKQPQLIEHGIRFHAVGAWQHLAPDLVQTLRDTEKMTAAGNSLDLVLAVNYGGRDEICRATRQIAHDVRQGCLAVEAIDEELFARYLDTAPWGDPDLLIRTGGERRISNFLLWQISYAEVYLTNSLWPDFEQKDFLEALAEYQRRERRRGG